MTSNKTFLTSLFLTVLGLGMGGLSSAHAQDDGSASAESTSAKDVFVVVSSGEAQTQMMAMVLGNQVAAKGASVRVLLCDSAARLAVQGESFPTFEPAGRTPQNLLQGLMQKGATVEVCAIFLPNTEYESSDLLDGVGVAKPGPIADHMLKPGVRYFTF
ncbi:DsrE family protein [Salinibacter ruber]|uniref:DsrE family protein n=1 Tax=Salinibacter ruber TaxID=146919 RepID=UPI000E577E37|nr:DsrE family protein [Salinibacter ruber]